jgi:hypothetical protein
MLTRTLYGAGQTARTVWYGAQYNLAQRLAPRMDAPPPKPDSMPGWGAILRDLGALRRAEWRAIEAGYYPAPADMVASPRKMIGNALRFVKDLPAVNLRRRLRINSEVFDETTKGKRPRYYLQNFHYQSGGWLEPESADIYDHQVEVLFTGGADTMRRQALVPLGDWIRANGAEGRTLLDVACGTARFLFDVKRAHPALNVIGLDMSEAYLAKARRNLRRWPGGFRPVLGKAEALPLADDGWPGLDDLRLPVPRTAPQDQARGNRGNGARAETRRAPDHCRFDTNRGSPTLRRLARPFPGGVPRALLRRLYSRRSRGRRDQGGPRPCRDDARLFLARHDVRQGGIGGAPVRAKSYRPRRLFQA